MKPILPSNMAKGLPKLVVQLSAQLAAINVEVVPINGSSAHFEIVIRDHPPQ